jgi:hypothetical protein
LTNFFKWVNYATIVNNRSKNLQFVKTPKEKNQGGISLLTGNPEFVGDKILKLKGGKCLALVQHGAAGPFLTLTCKRRKENELYQNHSKGFH